MRAKALKDQKEELLEQRRVMQKEAAIQKQKINDVFEKMKSKGKMDSSEMNKLGISLDQRAHDPSIRSYSPPEQTNNSMKSNSQFANQTIRGRAGRSTGAATLKSKSSPKIQRPAVAKLNQNLSAAPSQPQYNAKHIKKQMDNLRKKFNEELLNVLEEEQLKENSREQQILQVSNPQEAQLLEQQFGLERAKASQKIIEISNQHEQIILQEMKRLGLV